MTTNLTNVANPSPLPSTSSPVGGQSPINDSNIADRSMTNKNGAGLPGSSVVGPTGSMPSSSSSGRWLGSLSPRRRRRGTYDLEAPIIREGILLKKGHFRTNWKSRVFRLQAGKISYFDKPEDKLPIKTLRLAGVTVNRVFGGQYPRLFELSWRGGRDTYLLRAPTDDDLEDWLEAIPAAAKLQLVPSETDQMMGSGRMAMSAEFDHQQLQEPLTADVPDQAVARSDAVGIPARSQTSQPGKSVSPPRQGRSKSWILRTRRGSHSGTDVPPSTSPPATAAASGGGLRMRTQAPPGSESDRETDRSPVSGGGADRSIGPGTSMGLRARSPTGSSMSQAFAGLTTYQPPSSLRLRAGSSGAAAASSSRANRANTSLRRRGSSVGDAPLSPSWTAPPSSSDADHDPPQRRTADASSARHPLSRAKSPMSDDSNAIHSSAPPATPLDHRGASGTAGGLVLRSRPRSPREAALRAERDARVTSMEFSSVEKQAIDRILHAQKAIDEQKREYEQKRQTLIGMGFTSKIAQRALVATDGNVEEAAKWILSRPGLLEKEGDTIDEQLPSLTSPRNSTALGTAVAVGASGASGASGGGKSPRNSSKLSLSPRASGALSTSASAHAAPGANQAEKQRRAEEHYRAAQRIMELQAKHAETMRSRAEAASQVQGAAVREAAVALRALESYGTVEWVSPDAASAANDPARPKAGPRSPPGSPMASPRLGHVGTGSVSATGLASNPPAHGDTGANVRRSVAMAIGGGGAVAGDGAGPHESGALSSSPPLASTVSAGLAVDDPATAGAVRVGLDELIAAPLPLPDATKHEILQWTRDTLINKGDPRDFYDVDWDTRLGKGGFGEVYKAQSKQTGQTVAIKKMRINRKNKMEYLLIETELHARASQYPGVVRYYDAFCLAETREFWVVMEFVDGGPLSSFIELDAFREPQIAYVSNAVLLALCHIHRCNRLHRDIKSANILIDIDATVKLTDFGLAAQLTQQQQRRRTVLGTSDFMAPEIIRRAAYGTAVDVWAMGMLCFEMAKGETPFNGLTMDKVLASLETNGPPRLTNKKWSPEFRDIIDQCLQMLPEKRPAARELVLHPFFKRSCTRAEFKPLVSLVKSKGGGGCSIQ